MHIVLDLQACQSPEGRRRGIGRYSLSLAKAMAAAPRGHEITVLLNASMGDSIEFIRGQFGDLLPQDRLVTWESLSPTASSDPANTFRMRTSEVLRAQVLRQLKPDVVHVASLFDGWGDDVIAAVTKDPSYLTAVTLYDLIPLGHRSAYLSDPSVFRWYMEKIGHLREAELLLGISRYSCTEAEALLDIPKERLVEISGASDEVFFRIENAEAFRDELMRRYGLQRPFVMYAGGFDARKNIDALIRAFARLPLETRRAHQLLIVGGAPAAEQEALADLARELGLDPGEVIFAGYVPDSDLVKLYNLCALYAFPSLQEGFGLPALEAMSSGAVVIGSATSSLPEVIGRADALFDPRDVASIAGKMLFALTDENFRASFREHASRQCRRFSWPESAKRALDAFEAAVARHKHGKSRSAAPAPAADAHDVTAFLPAPRSSIAPSLPAPVVVYAASDCEGVTSERSLADFAADRNKKPFGRVVIELADDVYCARTLAYATTGAVDILLRQPHFGAALHALSQSAEGRALVVSLLYRAGGYPAIRAAVESGFSESRLATLVTPESLLVLGRSQVLRAEDLAAAPQGPWAWRKALRETIDKLIVVEGVTEATAQDWSRVAAALADNSVVPGAMAQWLVDISNLAVHDAGTGIQRVVRHVLDELMALAPPGYRVEPVCLGSDGILRYARSYCRHRYFESESLPPDEPVELKRGDVYLGLDLGAHLVAKHIDVFRRMRNRGIRQYYVVYDLLPLLRPDCFDPPGLPLFRSWYESIAEVADGVLCISKAVADEFESWLHQLRPERQRPLTIGWFHLGADIAPAKVPQAPGGEPFADLLELGDRPTFLMVGTVEPRKGHAQTLAACEQLWQQGIEINLLLIGKPGWLVDDLLRRMAEHPERGKRFFWFEKAGDDLLLAAYRRASALIMASEGEGFGLPLIEAAHHGLPVIVRDLPVFREIAGEHAHYFSGYGANDLGDEMRVWLDLRAAGHAPPSTGMQWNTWKAATEQMLDVVCNDRWLHRWLPGPVRRCYAFDYRLHTEVGRLERGRIVANGARGLLLQGPRMPMGTGRYTLRVLGGGCGAATLEVVSAAATRTYAQCRFVAHGGGDQMVLAQLELAMHEDSIDLEVRVLVDAGADIWLAEIQIAPVGESEPVAPIAA